MDPNEIQNRRGNAYEKVLRIQHPDLFERYKGKLDDPSMRLAVRHIINLTRIQQKAKIAKAHNYLIQAARRGS